MSVIPLVLAPAPSTEANDTTTWSTLVESTNADSSLLETTVAKFGKQILADLAALEASEPHKITRAADFVSRPRTSRTFPNMVIDYLSTALVGPRTSPLSRIQQNKMYTNTICKLHRALETRDKQMELLALERAKTRRGWKLRTLTNYYDIDWSTLPNPWPIHELVLRPVAMPVEIPGAAVFKDIFADLASDATSSTMAERGKIFEDGRLDMCKQVVGPPHISTLMRSLRGNTHIEHFLLGNNVSGTAGVDAISEYIRTKPAHSHIKTWYLAGNEIDGAGMSKLVDAMLRDTDMKYLWLKRNPIGSEEGADALARLVAGHSTLRLLDLQESGILDAGLIKLCEGLRGNRTLRTLYLDGCGIRSSGIAALAAVLNTTQIRNLYLSVNAFRDEGCLALAAALRSNKTLKRLSLSSVGMGPAGCKAICEALHNHPTLFLLDLGFYRTTIVLRELPNHLTDEAAPYVADLLRCGRLESFSVKCCYMTPAGMEIISEGMAACPSLIAWNVRQFDWCYSGALGNKIAAMRDDHRAGFSGNPKHLNDFNMRNPHCVEYIRSVYRGKM